MLKLDRLTIQYGDFSVAKAVDAQFEAGNIYTILGVNGAGKSSLLKAVFGAIEFSGTISYEGKTQRKGHLNTWRKDIAYMPQDSNTDADLTTLEVVLLGRMDALSRRISDDLLHEAVALLAELNISHLAHRPISALSGGQRQLAMFAQALLRRPKILLLDEPVSALDMAHQINLLDKVSHYTKQHQLICIMVLHDLSLAAQFSDEVLLLADGNITAQGMPSNVMRSEILRQVYHVDIEILTSHRGLPVIHPYRKRLASA
ncbi:ABC transporter ATP-binding protein [Psychrobacter aestuarii]|uniref:ABC transporter ATP-binding protein n=1 Tax=Psychrobacter aestuarii TaxID=556327 RepID=A0ABP3F894_9GAMM|nr:ABC transporter ATP-binding protein [Psychrobacter aestuarii]